MKGKTYNASSSLVRPELVEIKNTIRNLKKDAEMRLTLDVEAQQSFEFLSEQVSARARRSVGRTAMMPLASRHSHRWSRSCGQGINGCRHPSGLATLFSLSLNTRARVCPRCTVFGRRFRLCRTCWSRRWT